MITLTLHYPSFIDLDEPRAAIVVKSLDDLLTREDLKRWSDRSDFSGFAYSTETRTLMATYKDGYEWWVIGSLSEAVPGLPEWKAKYREAAI